MSRTGNTLFLVSCAALEGFGQTSYTVIIDGQGIYQGTYTCTIAPQIQYMISNYTDSIIYSDFDNFSTPIDAGPITLAAVETVQAGFTYGQNGLGNSIGDSIKAILTNQVHEQETTGLFLEFLEAYIQGIIEFTGTIMFNQAVKTNLSLTDGPFQGNPPSTMTRSVTGNATVDTVAWQYKTMADGLFLIPIVCVALASISITLVAQFYNRGIPKNHADFDPDNPWQLMAAASAGGMTQVFHGMGEDVKVGLDERIMLGQVGGRDGFVHTRYAGAELRLRE
ncbi:hypothetical protein B0H13DRAFT_1912560 [Mycena leptocephala]|nr:hypothetical protein B0H13DRAFT_1912560 [Mycena leptocephala]